MKTTSDGPEREIIKQSDKIDKEDISLKGVWTDDEMNTIINTLLKYKKSSLKAIKNHLNSKYEIEITETILKRVKNELS